MFSIQRLSAKIDELSANCLDVDAFEDWFLAESWGHYGVHGESASKAIAAVHHVLHSYERDEIEESQVAAELANAILPFVEEPSMPAQTAEAAVVLTDPELISEPDSEWSEALRKRVLESASASSSSDSLQFRFSARDLIAA